MFVGIMWAFLAGLMLGLYALPGKFTKGFKEENTWGLFFMLTMFAVPLMATFIMLKGIGDIYAEPDVKAVLPVMVIASVLWGIGVMMWGKAIHHIGVSLGFSLFIGTVILIGSILPIGIKVAEVGFAEGLPSTGTLVLILAGIAIVLLGIVFNGRAGLIREADEKKEAQPDDGKKSMAAGIAIAVIGGVLATGFNVAFTVGGDPLKAAIIKAGNPEWMVALAVMFPIFLSGGVIMAGYFSWQLTAKKAWGGFKTPSLPRNFCLIFIMAFFHYAASVAYAYGASRFDMGPVVVYAIFNTTCVVVAVISGIITREWAAASQKARKVLYTGLACMVLGVMILTVYKFVTQDDKEKDKPDETAQVLFVEKAEVHR